MTLPRGNAAASRALPLLRTRRSRQTRARASRTTAATATRVSTTAAPRRHTARNAGRKVVDGRSPNCRASRPALVSARYLAVIARRTCLARERRLCRRPPARGRHGNADGPEIRAMEGVASTVRDTRGSRRAGLGGGRRRRCFTPEPTAERRHRAWPLHRPTGDADDRH
jgi:hypothetical protein